MARTFICRTFGNNTGGGIVPPPVGPQIHYQALLGVQADIQSLSLAGPLGTVGSPGFLGTGVALPNSRVYLSQLPVDRNLILPCVIVSMIPQPEKYDGGTTAAEDVGYPCMATIVTPTNQDNSVPRQALLWRQQIRKVFWHRRPAGTVGALPVPLKVIEWEPAPILDLELWRSSNLFVSAAVIRVLTREVRPA